MTSKKSNQRRPRLRERQGEASSYLNLFRLSEGKVGDDVDGNQNNEAWVVFSYYGYENSIIRFS